jgi:PEP-CTERM motif
VLTFDLGVSTNGGPFAGTISVGAGINGSSTTFTDDGSTGTLTSDNTLWTGESLTFTATSASTVLSLIGETDSAGEFIGLDNVSVNVAPPSPPPSVPEPASMTLLGAGLVGVGVFRRRRSAR